MHMVIKGAIAFLVLAAASGCVPSSVIGPLQHERDEREKLMVRARQSGVSEALLNTVVPPLTPEEVQSLKGQDSSCRASYLWKNGLTWTGSILVAVAGGVTVGGAVGLTDANSNSKIVYGVSVGSLAALGAAFVAVGGIIQTGFTDRGCWVR
jgi:hypothetical protein